MIRSTPRSAFGPPLPRARRATTRRRRRLPLAAFHDANGARIASTTAGSSSTTTILRSGQRPRGRRSALRLRRFGAGRAASFAGTGDRKSASHAAGVRVHVDPMPKQRGEPAARSRAQGPSRARRRGGAASRELHELSRTRGRGRRQGIAGCPCRRRVDPHSRFPRRRAPSTTRTGARIANGVRDEVAHDALEQDQDRCRRRRSRPHHVRRTSPLAMALRRPGRRRCARTAAERERRPAPDAAPRPPAA